MDQMNCWNFVRCAPARRASSAVPIIGVYDKSLPAMKRMTASIIRTRRVARVQNRSSSSVWLVPVSRAAWSVTKRQTVRTAVMSWPALATIVAVIVPAPPVATNTQLARRRRLMPWTRPCWALPVLMEHSSVRTDSASSAAGSVTEVSAHPKRKFKGMEVKFSSISISQTKLTSRFKFF